MFILVTIFRPCRFYTALLNCSGNNGQIALIEDRTFMVLGYIIFVENLVNISEMISC